MAVRIEWDNTADTVTFLVPEGQNGVADFTKQFRRPSQPAAPDSASVRTSLSRRDIAGTDDHGA
jgi:hypothetical protein